MELQAIAKYYTDYSESYDLEFEKVQALAVSSKVLDEVGCGTGLLLERTHVIGAEVYDIDLLPKMVKLHRKKGLNAQEALITALSFKDDSFDLVYSFKVLAYVPGICKAMLEIVRVTRPDGRMIPELYNPISFEELTNWLRTLIRGYRPVCIRHDIIREIQKCFPKRISVVFTCGIRIFAFSAVVIYCPLSPVFLVSLITLPAMGC